MTQAARSRTRRFMTRALELAELAVTRGQTPFGAVVVDRDGQLAGEGHNTVRADRDPTAHGEIVAIRAAWRHLGAWQRLAGSTLYTSCEPCLLCSFVITQIGIGRVVFAARGTDVPTYRPLLGADLSGRRRVGERAAGLDADRGRGGLHARPRPRDHRRVSLGPGRVPRAGGAVGSFGPRPPP